MKKKQTVAALILCCLGYGIGQASIKNQVTTQNENYNSGTIAFRENNGQFIDDQQRAIPGVFFKSSGKRSDLWLTETGVTYVFKRSQVLNENLKSAKKTLVNSDKEVININWSRVDMELVGATIDKTKMIKENQSYGDINYYMGNRSITVKDYQKITFTNVYPNIDWVVKSDENGMKYDFVVKPGGDVNSIKLKYNYCDASLDKAGNLNISTPIGSMTESAPMVYYSGQKNSIESSFNLENKIISFNIPNYDKSKTLIIDPLQYVWATYYGGTDYETVYGLDTDASGNVYTSGWTYSTDFPTLNQGGGSYFLGTQQGQSDAYILKFNNSGVRLWATYFGGSAHEQCRSIAVDLFGNLWTVGSTRSNDFPVQTFAGAYNDPTFNGTGTTGTWGDGFIAKFAPTGSLLWATYFGGDSVDVAGSIRCTNSGDAYVCGITRSPNFPTQISSGAYYDNSYNGGLFDAYVLKFNNMGTLQWGSYFGGSSTDYCESVLPLPGNEVCFVGGTTSTNFPTLNPGGGAFFQSSNNGFEDGYIVQLNNSMALKWSTYIGGTDDEHYYFCNTNGGANIMTLGYTLSNDLPTFNPGSGAFFQSTNAGNLDLALTEFSTTNGAMTWGTYYGGPYTEAAYVVDWDISGNYYIGGEADSVGFPTQVMPGTYNDATFNDPSSSFHADGFLLSFNSARVRTWATYFYGNDFDFVNGINIDNSGDLYVVGETSSTNDTIINPGSGAWIQAVNNGGFGDIHISKFNNIPNGIPSHASSSSSLFIYPNPATNLVTLKVPGNSTDKLQVEIYSADGRLVSSGYKLSNSADCIDIDVTGISAGVYFVRAQSGNINATSKLIIKNK